MFLALAFDLGFGVVVARGVGETETDGSGETLGIGDTVIDGLGKTVGEGEVLLLIFTPNTEKIATNIAGHVNILRIMLFYLMLK